MKFVSLAVAVAVLASAHGGVNADSAAKEQHENSLLFLVEGAGFTIENGEVVKDISLSAWNDMLHARGLPARRGLAQRIEEQGITKGRKENGKERRLKGGKSKSGKSSSGNESISAAPRPFYVNTDDYEGSFQFENALVLDWISNKEDCAEDQGLCVANRCEDHVRAAVSGIRDDVAGTDTLTLVGANEQDTFGDSYVSCPHPAQVPSVVVVYCDDTENEEPCTTCVDDQETGSCPSSPYGLKIDLFDDKPNEIEIGVGTSNNIVYKVVVTCTDRASAASRMFG